MLTRVIYAAVALLIAYLVSSYLVAFSHVVWVVLLLLALVYVVFGDRVRG